MKGQPCQFGRVAARTRQIFFCFIRESDIGEGDDAVREKIGAAKNSGNSEQSGTRSARRTV